MNKMSRLSRITIAIVSLALTASYFLPVWFIFLIAPQYPEGLTMNIWLNKITGQVDIINGLNHYIGMKHIEANMFPEFKFMVYIVALFIVLGLTVAITGKRKLLFIYLILTLTGALSAMYDFYKWGYDYGHNLDPKAAIQVPGLSYQPPLCGHKTLLNFDAYSYPDSGGWIIIGVGITFFLVWVYEWTKNRKQHAAIAHTYKRDIASAAAIVSILFSSCSTKPEPFNYGKDICADCSMAIMDPRFGAEIITTKGRVYKFDDAHCVKQFMQTGKVKAADIAQTVFIDYENDKNFLPVESVSFVVSPLLKSPMNSNAAAFSNETAANKIATETHGAMINWNELMKRVNEK